MNKPIYLGFSILEISKTLIYEFWYNYMNPKYGENVKLCYMDTDSYIFHAKTEDFYEDIANDVEKWFDTSNYDPSLNRPLPMRKNRKETGLMKDELGRKIMTKFVGPRAKVYSYLMDDDSEAKKPRGTKTCLTEKMLKFNDYKNYLMNNKRVLKSQQRFKIEAHNVLTEEVNKVALSSDDDKRLQTYDKITTYSYGTSAGKVCKTELLSKVNIK